MTPLYQTMREIEKAYDGHWVFMVDCRKGDCNEIVGGVVVAFDKQKKPVADLWGKGYESETYFRYIGSIPEGMGVLM